MHSQTDILQPKNYPQNNLSTINSTSGIPIKKYAITCIIISKILKSEFGNKGHLSMDS